MWGKGLRRPFIEIFTFFFQAVPGFDIQENNSVR